MCIIRDVHNNDNSYFEVDFRKNIKINNSYIVDYI